MGIKETLKEQRDLCARAYLNERGYNETANSIMANVIRNAPEPKQVSVEPVVILQGELLPCPFCGDEVTLYKQPDRCFLLHTCEIIKSGFGEKNIIESKSKQSLTVIWNKRAGREPKSK